MLETKKDFEQLMFKIIDPLKSLYSKNCAEIKINNFGAAYSKDSIRVESFSRPLWALAPYWKGDGDAKDFQDIYIKGLTSGSDPQNDEYWGGFNDCDQRFVEMAAIACGVLMAKEKVWDPLSDDAKKNLAVWLDGINHYRLPMNNWLFFNVLVNLALENVNMPCDNEKMEENLKLIDSFYVGDGWSTDGIKPQKDYYIAWAIQYYSLLYSAFAKKRDPQRCKRFQEHAIEFGKQYATWFDCDGAGLPFGRSLTYHFAQCAFFSACVFLKIEPIPLPQMKGIIVRNIEWWLRQDIFDRDGVLTVGYCYPNLIMSENYNGPGCPYWALKSFLILALDENDDFFKIKSEPLNFKTGLKPLISADMLMQRFSDGRVTGYPDGVNEFPGHCGFPEKYSKFAYSTKYGFSCSRRNQFLSQAAPDSMLAFVIDENVFVRKQSKDEKIEGDRVVSSWVPFIGIKVLTEIIPTKNGHIRKHIVESEYDCVAYDCGFSIPKFIGKLSTEETENSSTAVVDDFYCKVVGKHCSCKGEIIKADANTNLYFTNTVIPAVKYIINKGKTVLETEIIEINN